jgi:protein phosphatase
MAVDVTGRLLARDLPQALRGSGVAPLLLRVFEEVSAAIFRKGRETPGLRGMGTTLVLLVFSPDRYFVAHAGDSRAYRVRRGELVQLTRDHSLVQLRIDAGLLRPEDAAFQPDRNIITRVVGTEPSVQPDLGEGTLADGDTFVLTTDGVHGVVPAGRILDLAARLPPREAAEALVREALRLGTMDNSTAVVVRALEARGESERSRT